MEGTATEDSLRYVSGKKGVIVRAEATKDSSEIGRLEHARAVRVSRVEGERALLELPVRGWVTARLLKCATRTVPAGLGEVTRHPVCAALAMASTTLSVSSSGMTTSSFTFGRKSTTYSAPR